MNDVVAGQGDANAPAPGATPEAPAATTPAPAGGDEPFYSTFEDASLKEWSEGKGWKDVESAVKSAYHLEKMVGVPQDQILRLPKQGDADGWGQVYDRLGRPAEAKDYEIPGLPEDEAGQAYANHLKEVYHKAGLSKEQAAAITESDLEFLKKSEEAAKEEYDRQIESDTLALKKEWGNGYEKQTAVARNAAQRLGFDEDAINALEAGIGFAGTMKLMATLGEKMGEDTYVSGENAGGDSTSAYTPAQAKQAWEAFKSDEGLMAALIDKAHPAHASAVQKKSDIFAVMFPSNTQQLS